MKLQLLFAPLLVAALILDIWVGLRTSFAAVAAGVFLVTAMPFTMRALAKDPAVGILSPALLAVRSCAQFLGVAAGLIHAGREVEQVQTRLAA
jgi:small-conductance mechanosensitive channel